MTKPALFGLTFDSRIEADRYLELRAMQDAGEIANLTVHPRFVLIDKAPGVRERVYTADFRYDNGSFPIDTVEEVKPACKAARSWTRDFPLRLAMARQRYPHVEFRVVER